MTKQQSIKKAKQTVSNVKSNVMVCDKIPAETQTQLSWPDYVSRNE